MSDSALEGRAARSVRSRRSQTHNSSPGARPDRVAAWAFALAIFLILVAATTSHGESGGASVPQPAAPAAGAAGATRPQLGERMLQRGQRGPGRAHAAVDPATPAATATLSATGRFDEPRPPRCGASSARPACEPTASSGPQTRPKLLALMRLRRATWYGPGPVREPHGLRPAAAAARRSAWRTARCPAARR